MEFILKYAGNNSYGTVRLVWTSVEKTPGVKVYRFFWQKSGESRTRYIGEYPPSAINTDVIKEAVRLADGVFCGWASDAMDWPSYIERWEP